MFFGKPRSWLEIVECLRALEASVNRHPPEVVRLVADRKSAETSREFIKRHMDQNLSIKRYSERLEARLRKMSVEELRDWIREAAAEVRSDARQGFLEGLRPRKRKTDAPEKAAGLMADIAELRCRLEKAMKVEPEWGYDDEEEVEVFEEFLPKLQRLFARARAVFARASFTAAVEAYRALFELSTMEDEYGRRVGLPSDLDAGEERARYLRAVVEASSKNRAKTLMQAWGELVGREELALSDIFEITPAPVEKRDDLLDDLIKILEKQGGDECDAWLRHATLLRHGITGLEALARREGVRRPYAWVDWVTAVAESGDQCRTAEAVTEALKSLPERLSLRAAVAGYGFRAAVKLRDGPAAAAARWEEFCAARSARSLLDLWEAVPAGEKRREWMARAADESLRKLPKSESGLDEISLGAASINRDGGDWPFSPDDGKTVFGRSQAVFYYEADARVTALARLLAGDWESAWKAARSEPVLGWSSSSGAQAFVVPAFFARMATVLGRPLPPAIEMLFRAALATMDDQFLDPDPGFADRLRQAFTESMASWKPDATTRSVVVQVALRRIDAIVDAKHRGAYERAAHLAVAAAEVLDRQGNAEESRRLLQKVIERHRRKYAFVGEIRRKQETLGYDPIC
jgi:tetratricopeptide (TPR) repeat protein